MKTYYLSLNDFNITNLDEGMITGNFILEGIKSESFVEAQYMPIAGDYNGLTWEAGDYILTNKAGEMHVVPWIVFFTQYIPVAFDPAPLTFV